MKSPEGERCRRWKVPKVKSLEGERSRRWKVRRWKVPKVKCPEGERFRRWKVPKVKRPEGETSKMKCPKVKSPKMKCLWADFSTSSHCNTVGKNDLNNRITLKTTSKALNWPQAASNWPPKLRGHLTIYNSVLMIFTHCVCLLQKNNCSRVFSRRISIHWLSILDSFPYNTAFRHQRKVWT